MLKVIFLTYVKKKKLENVVIKEKPDYIFHLAAQSIVYKSILNPRFNWETNVMGLFNLLEAINKMKKKCCAVIITSDKCYKNLEIKRGYKEDDVLGGIDPIVLLKHLLKFYFIPIIKPLLKIKKRISGYALQEQGM